MPLLFHRLLNGDRSNMNKEKYKAKVKCDNCGFDGEIEIEKRIKIEDTECPNCGCQNLRKRNVYESMEIKLKNEDFS